MSRAAATVNVVTTDGPAGRAGVTVSAMSSVSADGDAPTMLVCVHHAASAAPAIVENGVFCVNVMNEDQAAIADVFARRRPAPGGDKFAATETRPGTTGAPRIAGALVSFDCRVISAERVGTHHIFIGEVAGVALAPEGKPLVYAARAYGAHVPHAAPRDLTMAHKRIRPFNTKDTYPEQRLDNDLAQAVVARGTMVFLRGQCPQDLDTSADIASADPIEQTHKVMQNIRQLIEEAGGRMEHLVKIVVYLTDVRHREAVYRTMGEYIEGVHPVSTGVTVTALARPGWLVEIDATAVIPD